MATGKEYMEFVVDQLEGVEELSVRRMMGEYLLYSSGKLFGGLYDNRLLLKDTPTLRSMVASPQMVVPYPGAKPMVEVDPEDREFLLEAIGRMLGELPEPRRRG